MSRVPVIAVFDIGKTNKKLLLFDEQHRIVHEVSEQLPQTVDEDGFPCDDVVLLTQWLYDRFEAVLADDRFDIRVLNFSAYGASFVHLDMDGKPLTPLYNYLKPFPDALLGSFILSHGSLRELEVQTASPFLGSLNSGLQVYRLRRERPEIFHRTRYSLHLPQYLSYLFSGHLHTELTSVGCHTLLWDFSKGAYHDWVKREGLDDKFPPFASGKIAGHYKGVAVGLGYHDSSAALALYLQQQTDPFLLVSTGTWCISMNPFNDSPLTEEEFAADCLCYLTPSGRQVKSSRYFGGDEHEKLLKHLSAQYPDGEASAAYRDEYVFGVRHIVSHLKTKIDLVMSENIRNIFVDGGFSRNSIFIELLAQAYPRHAVTPADVPQASAIGAAMLLH